MKINDIYENFKRRKTNSPSESKKNLEKIAFKSEGYFVLNASIISFLTEIAIVIFGKKLDFLTLLFVSPFMFIALTGLIYGITRIISLPIPENSAIYSKLSRFMPYNLLMKIMPAKISKKINNIIFNQVLPNSLIEIEDLKQLSSLATKEEMNSFLRICEGEPTYYKMMEYFKSIECESEQEEKINLLTNSLYSEKTELILNSDK